MRRHVRYMLLYGYYFARLIGIIAFAIEQKAGVFRVRSSRAIVVYSLLANLFVVGKLKFVYNPDVIELLKQRVQPLHIVIYFVTTIVRGASMVVTIAFGWKRRAELMTLIREYLQLRSDFFNRLAVPPRLQQRFECLITRKFVLSTLGDICAGAVVRDLLRDTFTSDMFVTVGAVSLVASYLSSLLNLYYFVIVLVNFHGHWLNSELLRIMRELREACAEHRRRPTAGAFLTRCCQLADELDALAVVYGKMSHLWGRFNLLLDIQGCCTIGILYLNNISIVYLCYVLGKSELYFFRLSPVGVGFLCVALVLYYWDLEHFVTGMDEMLRTYAKCSKLVEQHYLALPLLDVRLERSIESFTMQLNVDPLEHDMRGLFKFTLPFVFSLFVSSIVNSIILVQYDYQYY